MDSHSIAIGRSVDQKHGCHSSQSSFKTRFVPTVRWRCQLADERSQETGSPVDPWVTSKKDFRECELSGIYALMWLQHGSWIQDGPHITSMGPFWFRPWWEGRGLRCRIGDGALSGESKQQLRILLVWDTNSFHFDRQGHHSLGLTGFIQHWFSWQGQIAWLVVSSATNLHYIYMNYQL